MQSGNDTSFVTANESSVFCKNIQNVGAMDVAETVFCYTDPFDSIKQQVFALQYGVGQETLGDYCKNVIRCVERHVSVTAELHKNNEALSVLYSRRNTSEVNESGRAFQISVTTEYVEPILEKLFSKTADLITLLEVMIRLSTILRDVAKVGFVHRGLDMREVYLTADGKIRLGGFYYATGNNYKESISYLPECPPYLKSIFRDGEAVHPCKDIRCAATILYNLLSGLPWDTQWNGVPTIRPEYAPDCVLPALEAGLTATEEDFGQFRKKLLECRKILCQAGDTTMIPIVHLPRKQYRKVEEVTYSSGNTADNRR